MQRRGIATIVLLISAAIATTVYLFYDDPAKTESIGEGPIGVPELDMKTEYGLLLDTLNIEKATIGRNEFLAEILQKHNVSYEKIDELVKVSRPVFNVRKFRSGNTYSIISSGDSIKKALYFVYEIDPTRYIVYDLRDTVKLRQGVKEVQVKVKTASGRIETSLWNTMIDNETDPNLANELSEIFAWVIDFFGIQRGDYYKAIYEELYVGEERIGLGNVLSARFNHMDEDYFAFYFIQDSIGDYFDDQAGSMRRTFLKAPLRFRRVSSGFSYNRLHPVLKIYRPHTGVDYAADYGTPVHAVGEGEVIMAGWTKQGGRAVKIRHNGTYTTVYMHLSDYGKGIRKGVKVKQGDIIGYVGSSGLATGPHLDFRFYRNGKPVNPLKVESPPAEPVKEEYLDEFLKLKEQMMQELSTVPDPE